MSRVSAARRGRFARLGAVMAIAVVAGLGATSSAHAAAGPLAQAIADGKHMFIHDTFGGRGMTCESCHRAAGMGPTVVHGRHFPSLANAAAIFPRYNPRAHKVITLEDQIRGCVARGLGGKPPAGGSKAMADMVAYLTSLSQGKPIAMGAKPR
ncbi:c-type cytochrome [Acidihalobacter prosperus]|uniref:Cytochrome c domain-containing protein n=1 Tax=Acidihalobacter prosperus TaxID=160660 RepID=A0A1A6C5R3_9GAMM|nr:cytochrome C [Acidihalobacter prosperus]OBS09884.1 hypothetical protein Thpro_020934 [Acidihalobacter prosperus]